MTATEEQAQAKVGVGWGLSFHKRCGARDRHWNMRKEREEKVTIFDHLTEIQNSLSNRMGLMCTKRDLNESKIFQILETVKH